MMGSRRQLNENMNNNEELWLQMFGDSDDENDFERFDNIQDESDLDIGIDNESSSDLSDDENEVNNGTQQGGIKWLYTQKLMLSFC